MFNKEEKSTFSKDWGLGEKKELFKKEVVEVPKPIETSDAKAIIKSIGDNPDKSATFSGCDSSVWNEVYLGLNKMKLHNFCKWDTDSEKIKYK